MKRSVVFLVIFSLLFDQIPFYTLQQNIKQREAPLVVEGSRTLNYDVQTTYPIEEAPLEEPLDDTSPSNTYPIEEFPSDPEPIILPEEDDPEDTPVYEPEPSVRPLPPAAAPWLKLAAEPAIFVPGAANSISWSVQGYESLRLSGSVQLLVTFSEGLLPTDATLAAQYLTQGVLSIPLTAAEGLIFLNHQGEAPSPSKIVVNFTLQQGEEVLDSNSVVWPYFNSETQTPLTSPENPLGVKLNGLKELTNKNIVFTIDLPSPHTLPGISPTGAPFEILAADVAAGTSINQFASPITLTVPYSMERFQPDQEADLQLFYYNPANSAWYPLETVVDTVSKTLSVQTDHLTVFDYKPGEWQSYIPPILESYQVSEFTGAATYQIDLPTFEGPNGLKPELSLTYNSQIIDEGSAYSQASWVGMGWSLETGMITRDMHGTNGTLTDDSYMLSLGGISGRLLPISSSGTKTSYALSQDSFDKIEFDSASNSWTVYSKDGLVYLFGDGNTGGTSFNVKYSNLNGCETNRDVLINWGWALRKITDRFGNAIDFSYDIQKKGPTCLNDIAILPKGISYAGGKFEINFVLEERSDYLPSWNDSSSRVLFSKKRLDKVQFLVNNAIVKTYDLTYGNGQSQAILPKFEWQGDARTSTLVSFKEQDAGGSALPSTTFVYGDYMHITEIKNGYGGEITFTYEQHAKFDDFNDSLRMANWRFGENQCNFYFNIGTDWVERSEYAQCKEKDSKGPYLLLGIDDLAVGIYATHSIPENIVKPGSEYRFYLLGKSSHDENTGTHWGFKGGGSQIFINGILPANVRDPELGPIEGSITMPVTYDINEARLFIENTGSYIKTLQVVLYVTRYTVSSRTETDRAANTSAIWTYAYTGLALNGGGVGFYIPKNSEFRGFGEVVITRDDGLQIKNTYSQTDALKGRLLSSVVSDAHTGQKLAETIYSYKSGEVVSNANLVTSDGSNLKGYPDLDVLWTRTGSTESLTFLPKDTNGQLYGTGSRVKYDYNGCVDNAACELTAAKNQGSGNLTGTTYSVKQNDSGWVADHANWVSYNAPVWSGGAYLGQIPLAQTTVQCTSAPCSPSQTLLQETLYNYYPNWQLKYQRDWAKGSASSRQYSLSYFAYNANGSLSLTRAWQDFFNSSADPGSTGSFMQVQYWYEGFFPNAVTRQITSGSDGRIYQTITTAYDERHGLPIRVTQAENGVSEGAAYDTFGRMTKICAPGDWNPASPCADASNTGTVKISYSPTLPYRLAVTTPSVPGAARQDYYYDGFGRLLQSQLIGVRIDGVTQNQVTRAIGYDGYGRETLSTQPFSYTGTAAYQANPFSYEYSVTQTDYDLLGRVVLTGRRNAAGALNMIAAYSYTMHADSGNWLLQTSVTDANNNTSKTLTNAKGQLILSTPPAAAGPSTRFSYNALGQLISSQYGSALTTLSYYPSGLKSQMTDADMGTWAYTYDAQGNLLSQTDAKGQKACLGYDGLNRLIGKLFLTAADACPGFDDSWPVRYGWDEGAGQMGYRTSMTDASGYTLWSYDARGRLVSESKTVAEMGTYTTRWAYNGLDQLTSMAYPSGEVVNFGYLPQGVISSVSSRGISYLAAARYDAFGRVSTRSFGNGTSTQYQYADWPTAAGWLQALQSGLNGGEELQNLVYAYDPAGNITQIFDGTDTLNFAYDALNRLTGVSGAYSQTYTYNPASGNLTTKSDVGSYTYSTSHPHAVTQAGSNSYTYDANGNVISRQVAGVSTTYAYDAENRLISVLENGQLITEYGYDGDGNRVWEKDYQGWVAGQPALTLYIGDYFEVQWDGGTVPAYTLPFDCEHTYCTWLPLVGQGPRTLSYYYADGQRIVVRDNLGQVGWLYGDHLGSTSVTSDAQGAETSRMSYYAWGTTRFEDGESPTDYGYTGQMQEGDLYYYGARWYDPLLGRFLQPDTIVPSAQGTQAFDRYAYVNNNPLRYTDPSGHCIFGVDTVVCITVGAMAVGAIGGYVSQVAENRSQGMDWGEALTTNISGEKIVGGAVLAGGVAVGAMTIGTIGTSLVAAFSTTATYACADGDCTNEVASAGSLANQGYGSLTHAAENGINPYGELHKVTAGTGLQVHHLVETRFANVLKLTNEQLRNIPSVILTPAEHQIFTNQWRYLIAYNNSTVLPNTATATLGEIRQAAMAIYQQYPTLLKVTNHFLESLQ